MPNPTPHIEAKIEEFREKFTVRGEGEDFKNNLSASYVEKYLSFALTQSYALGKQEEREDIASKLKEMRIEHPTICKVWDDENTHCTCDQSPETYNGALRDVSALLQHPSEAIGTGGSREKYASGTNQ